MSSVARVGRCARYLVLLSLVTLASGLVGIGCAHRIPPPKSASQGDSDPDRAWGRVLSRFVDEKGRIDFEGIAKSPDDLETYVAWIASTSPASAPASFPTLESRLAYYLNAYNALAIYDVWKSNFPPNLYAVRVSFFYKNRFDVGRRPISLYALENQVIRPLNDPRVHVALNCMARGCPRLPREPFRAAELDRQLDRQAREFYGEDRNVKLEPDGKTVRLSEILKFYTADFLKKSPSLIAYVNDYRTEKIPPDWKVEFIPYDWTLNRQ